MTKSHKRAKSKSKSTPSTHHGPHPRIPSTTSTASASSTPSASPNPNTTLALTPDPHSHLTPAPSPSKAAKHHSLLRTTPDDVARIGHSKSGSSTSVSSEPVIRVDAPSPGPKVKLATAADKKESAAAAPAQGPKAVVQELVVVDASDVANEATASRDTTRPASPVPSSPHLLAPTSPLIASLRTFSSAHGLSISTGGPTPLNPDGTPGTPRRMQHRYLSHPSSSADFTDPPTAAEQAAAVGHELPYGPHQPPPPYYESGKTPSFVATPRGTKPLKAPTLIGRARLLVLQTIGNVISTYFLVGIVAWALADRIYSWYYGLLEGKEYKRDWDDPKKWKKEACVKDVKYYAKQCGYEIEDQTVETTDGYLLRVHKVIVPGRSKEETERGYPVLIMHGLFQSSGSFVTSEERSLAFWLAEKGGYQVYLGNNRGVFDMGHKVYKRSDPRFWDYNIRELALYDVPALVDHVRLETGFDKIAFIGHSQGNATMFCSLAQGMVPSLGTKLSIFIALAPAVFAGPLTSGFPFWAIKSVQWPLWRRLFGVLDFIPLMRWSYDWVPGYMFGRLGYIMFSFLFGWTDANWLQRRKPKMFRFTPTPVPSAGIFWWTGYNGFSTRGCVLDPAVYKWYDQRFPPLSIYHGGKDLMVLTDPLLARLKDRETDVKVQRVHELPEGEHCDFFWHVDAVELCFGHMMEDIEATKVITGHRFLNGLSSRSANASSSSTEETKQALGITF